MTSSVRITLLLFVVMSFCSPTTSDQGDRDLLDQSQVLSPGNSPVISSFSIYPGQGQNGA